MVVVVVSYNISESISLDKARDIFSRTSGKYKSMPGLIRKYYLVAENGISLGGVYLWNSKEDAEKIFNEEWFKYILNLYGVEPDMQYYNSPVIVDNLTGEVNIY